MGDHALPTDKRPRRRFGKVAALLLASLGFAFLIGELTVRGVYGDKFGRRPGFFQADTLLHWRPTPDLHHTYYGSDFKIRVDTDADGYRLGGLGMIDYSRPLVVLVGDSNVFGWGVDGDETFASYLDDLLDGSRAQVVNLGVGGYGTFQNVLRVQEFLAKHPHAQIEAVVVVHSPNDAIDNARFAQQHPGRLHFVDKESPRNIFHIINMIDYARRITQAKRDGETHALPDRNHPFLQDLLFAFDVDTGLVYPDSFIFEGDVLRPRELGHADTSPYAFADADSLTPKQEDMMKMGVAMLHRALLDSAAPVYHIALGNTPQWFGVAMGAVVGQAPRYGVRVEYLGRLPAMGNYEGDPINAHSGRHFTPRFNRYWAESFAAALKRRDAARY